MMTSFQIQALCVQIPPKTLNVTKGFNIPSYSLLVHMIAQQCNLEAGDFIWTGGDVHVYKNHFEQAQLQLTREPRELPKLLIKRKPSSIFDYTYEDFEIQGYDPHPLIKAPISV